MINHKSKTLAGLLAMLLGTLGAHRLYLGFKWWWLYLLCVPFFVLSFESKKWFQEPVFFIAMIGVIASLLDAIIISLTPDEAWDARFNSHSAQTSANRWPPVLIAIMSLLIGSTLLIATLAIMFQTYFEASGQSLG
jgi:hypothetical protein